MTQVTNRPLIAALSLCAALSIPAAVLAKSPATITDAINTFLSVCLKNRGNHGATLAAVQSARGFSVTDTSAVQGIKNRILASHRQKQLEVFAMQYQGADLCGVGITPTGHPKEALVDIVAKLAASLNVPTKAFKKRGKELRLKTSSGTIKVVLNRVYPVSINMETK